MNTGKKGTVIPFPLSRTADRAPGRTLLKRVEGKIVAVPASKADTIGLVRPSRFDQKREHG
ncbi:MAG: hypothetical protein WBX25_05590 [Rhodomicrobium sp.]